MTRRNFTKRVRSSRPESDAPADATLAGDLARLRASETGVGYIYFALDLLASRYALSDAYIVIDLGASGKQVFRLGGRTTFPARDDMQTVNRGLYYEPAVVPEDDARIFYEACAQELTRPRPMQPGINKVYSPTSLPNNPAVEAPSDASDAQADDWFVSGSTGDEWDAQSYADGPSIRRLITRLFLVVDVANFIFALLGVHGPARFFLGLIFGVLIPGWSIVGLFRIGNAGLEVGLSVAVSLSLIMVCAQIMITLNLWHLITFEEILCGVTLIPLWVQSTASWMERSKE